MAFFGRASVTRKYVWGVLDPALAALARAAERTPASMHFDVTKDHPVKPNVPSLALVIAIRTEKYVKRRAMPNRCTSPT